LLDRAQDVAADPAKPVDGDPYTHAAGSAEDVS